MNTIEAPKSVNKPRQNQPWHSRLRVWGRRVLVTLVLLAVIGAAYQAIATARDERAFPPPGQLVDVGGYKLHLYCTGLEGSGNPTVILETLAGGLSPYWAWVQPVVAKMTRVCAYDRPGRAWSESATRPLSLQQTVDDLHTLLANAGVAPPYLLVGHSIGGLYVRKFAADHPDEVVGLVLVDAAHPEQFDHRPEMLAETQSYLRVSWLIPWLMQLGVGHLYFASGGEVDFQALPPRQHDEVAAFWSSPGYFQSQRAEMLASVSIYADAHDLGDLGDLPLAVVSAGRQTAPGWAELQDELAQLSTNSIHITNANAIHASLAFDPQDAKATTTAILQVVEAVRRGTPLQ